MLSQLEARISNRLAMRFGVTPLQLRNDTAMVSFTFDDAPKSAATLGAAMLEEYDAHATYYVSGGLVGRWASNWVTITADDIVSLHRRGHEIACHTFSHKPVTRLSAAGATAEIEQNRQYLHAVEPSIRIENFAYPYGLGSASRKGQLKQIFHSSRGILPGVNSGVIDLQYLRSTPLIGVDIDSDGVDRAFDEAAATNGWLIFYSHDVAKSPSRYGCLPSLLRHALDAAARRSIPILSVAEALRRASA
jgi:peptidoglycan/xylan/chitin deacetylase (PgdA/CDA1 family)